MLRVHRHDGEPANDDRSDDRYRSADHSPHHSQHDSHHDNQHDNQHDSQQTPRQREATEPDASIAGQHQREPYLHLSLQPLLSEAGSPSTVLRGLQVSTRAPEVQREQLVTPHPPPQSVPPNNPNAEDWISSMNLMFNMPKTLPLKDPLTANYWRASRVMSWRTGCKPVPPTR